MTDPKHMHEVKITGTPDAPKIEFVCHGDSTAICHQYPDCDCETWSEGHPHPMASHDRCWMQDWFDNDGTAPFSETLDECKYTVGMSGPIRTYFCEEYVEWEFAPADGVPA
ncbi:hypothetical protein Mbo4_049 [Rhodococcus phage Mbo4]|uniref:Uncharacterized protein n=2 Tax=root TaxID=1 RepID=A0A9E7IEN5_9CAUD|nr:hypothetical protein [Rhodococcus opacus]YP_010755954.1 hypothetical protein QEH50_gp49 [Rhodococcus phage Mbo4]EKT83069.1 hypothetical protein WSS_A09137 [Rhodococcus opacus M213]URG17539.1 hypothetical protein Mbo4_049 [Rhodococcus phage Mbo4]